MNLLEVQDDLKNFSQDQLVKEMQQPSGNAPQFLVLSELNRRKRVKGDFEARQAKQQPTVAEEAVAAAGVPQQGMMGMSEAMAPQSAVSEGVGTNAPMKMASGGLAQFGNEIREGMGQEIDPYLDGVQQEAEQKFNVDLDNNLQQTQPGTGMARPGYRGPPEIRPSIAYPHQVGFGGKGMPRPSVVSDMRARIRPSIDFSPAISSERLSNTPFGNQTRRFAEGGVIRAANGFAGSGKSSDDIIKQMEEKDKAVIEEDDDTENISEDVENNTPVTTGKGTPNYSILPMLGSSGTDTVEQDIINLQKGLEKERALDRNLALAQAGLGIMSSTAPTLAQAIGEGGSKGLEAFRDSNKRYQEGVVDLINARAKIAAGRKKGKLTASQVLSALQKTRGELYGKLGDYSQITPDFTGNPARENQLKAQEKYLVQLLQEYGVNLPETAAS